MPVCVLKSVTHCIYSLSVDVIDRNNMLPGVTVLSELWASAFHMALEPTDKNRCFYGMRACKRGEKSSACTSLAGKKITLDSFPDAENHVEWIHLGEAAGCCTVLS